MRITNLHNNIGVPDNRWSILLKDLFLVIILSLLLLLPVLITKGQNTNGKTTVTGRITDNSKEPLIGVSIVETGTINGTITDVDGNYTISVSPLSTLTFSFIGLKSQIIPVGTSTVIDVVLENEISDLNEVVIIGYGTQRKQDLTGSVSVVNAKETQKIISPSLSEKIQGRVTGVSIQTNGEPGSMGRINIRGIGSFSAVGPLYVIDGMIVKDIDDLNPNEIESIQILKDASSCAIYGSRGSNGVIIISTKKAKIGKPTLELTASYGLQELPKKIEMMNTIDYLYYNELAYLNAGMEWPANPVAGTTLPNSDFQDAIFRVGKMQDYNATYSHGSETSRMMMNVGYFSQDGVLEGPEYKRLTFRMNSESNYGILKIGENFALSRSNIKYANYSFTNALIMPPVIPVYDPNEPSGKGGFGYGNVFYPTYASNPVAQQQSFDNRMVDSRLVGNIFSELKLFNVFTYKLNLGTDFWYGRHKTKNYAYTMRMGSAENRYNDVLWEGRTDRLNLVAENTLTYRQTFNRHTIEALTGLTIEDEHQYFLGAEGYDQQVDGLWQIDLVGTQNNMWGNEYQRRLISYLGRVNYNYADKYLLQFNFRSDGSSTFGADYRRGYFPSASLGWRIVNEDFFSIARTWFNDLKFRTSYGRNGDQSALGPYDYIASINYDGPYEGFYAIFGPSNNETVNDGALQSAKVNTGLRWETKTTFNLGLDYSLFNEKLSGTFEYFNSKSSDLLLLLPQAWATGVETKWTNYGELRNKGFELMVNWRDNKGDFKYEVSANLSTIRNEVLSLGESYREAGWNGVNRTEKGRSVGDFFLIETAGIFQSMDEVFAHTTQLESGQMVVIQPNAKPGDIRYVDFNKDGQIDLNDRQWMGSPLPKFTAGLNFNAVYKGFDASFFLTASFGNKIFNAQRYELLKFDVDNYPADATPWTWDNPSNEYPRNYASSTDNRRAQTDRFLENGNFVRIKNLQLGYSLPEVLTQKVHMQKCRFYVSGQNLLTFTKYKGYDPELLNSDPFGQGIDWGGYPPVRTFNMGLQLTF